MSVIPRAQPQQVNQLVIVPDTAALPLFPPGFVYPQAQAEIAAFTITNPGAGTVWVSSMTVETPSSFGQNLGGNLTCFWQHTLQGVVTAPASNRAYTFTMAPPHPIQPGSSISLEFHADIQPGAQTGMMIPTLAVTGTNAASGTGTPYVLNSAVLGQLMRIR
jgi:hypothetical protein